MDDDTGDVNSTAVRMIENYGGRDLAGKIALVNAARALAVETQDQAKHEYWMDVHRVIEQMQIVVAENKPE